MSKVKSIHILRVTLCALLLFSITSAALAESDTWKLNLGAGAGAISTSIGMWPAAIKGSTANRIDVRPSDRTTYTLMYRVHSSDWAGPTGFYTFDGRPTVPMGSSETWNDIYLWSQNYTPDPSNYVHYTISYEYMNDEPNPCKGYWGHFVLDYVPQEANWTGPMDYWLNLGVRDTFLIPVATVTDPLQGTRMHFTVYTPEPSSLMILLCGLGGIGGVMWRRRK